MNKVTKLTKSDGNPEVKLPGTAGRASWAKAGKYLRRLLVLVFLTLVLFLLLAPHLWGLKFVTIMGGSMGPALPAGSIAVVQPVDSHDVEVGDVIAFSPEKEQKATIVTHRVVEVLDMANVLTFQTKGDNNKEPDRNAVTSANVIGQVRFHIPLVGYILHFIKQPLGYGLLICLPAIIIILVEMKNIREQINLSKKKSRLVLNKN
jgi:signal peptidase